VLTRLDRAVARLDVRDLARRRWFAGKGREPVSAVLVDALEIPGGEGGALVLVDVEHVDGWSERYALAARLGEGELLEASPADPLWPALARLVSVEQELPGLEGVFLTFPGPTPGEASGSGRALTDDQSNTSVVLGERDVVKCYRRLLPGVHPEPELLAGLSHIGSRRAPPFRGALLRRSGSGEEALACVYAFVPGEPVGWEGLIVRLRDALAAGDTAALDALALEMGAAGAAAAELHVDLARAFGVGLASAGDAAHAIEEARDRLAEARSVAIGELAAAVNAFRDALAAALDDLALLEGAPVARCHGDLHVAQFVDSPAGLVVVDFEGEPGRSPDARRRPGTPLRDLACLLLSFDHAAVAAARRLSFGPTLERGLAWSEDARAAASSAYRSGIAGSPLALDERFLRALEVEKECHEVIYAATVLPQWSYAPAHVLPRLADPGRSRA
jgi:maltokinase